uniref:Uncharacterized protein n=1 Tax=Trichuris muris TaxID=70415 RepID=A0A5S6Q733_TRIMR
MTTTLASMFESFLAQLRTDLRELKVFDRQQSGPQDSSNNDAVPAHTEVGQTADLDMVKPEPILRVHEKEDRVASDKNIPFSHGQNTSFTRADEWIDSVTTPSEHHNKQTGHCQPAMLHQLPPTITIEPFDGDPRKWDQFIGSFKALVHDVVPPTLKESLY